MRSLAQMHFSLISHKLKMLIGLLFNSVYLLTKSFDKKYSLFFRDSPKELGIALEVSFDIKFQHFKFELSNIYRNNWPQ